jgi:rhamnogalacturonyl hydrolase YesR
MKANISIASTLVLLFWPCFVPVGAQPTSLRNDVNTPLHLMQPDYPVPYGKTTIDDIKTVLDRIYAYLDATTPMSLINTKTNEEISDYSKINGDVTIKRGDFRIISYEWGVTYAGMLNAGEATGDNKFTSYTIDRLSFLGNLYPIYKSQSDANMRRNPLESVITPRALDDAGSMCAAMIKVNRAGMANNLRPIIDNYINYISTKEFRLSDGTLARNRPLPNTIWLDDLFMSVPALAQMGVLTGDSKYFDDAVKQVLQFSQRMFIKEKGLYMHGWVQDMEPHPVYHWARANGWAFMTMAELLDVLPENHPGYKAVLEQFRAHAKGLASYQSGIGFWHQLMDRNDSYLETSATAIYVYAYAKGINRGWLDKKAYGPLAVLAWNAVATKVNDKGQVEGTCVGTGMGFEPAFYYYRPVNVFAAHGYGPVLLAGSEMIKLLMF